jgi:PAS domain S-box-containing protein
MCSCEPSTVVRCGSASRQVRYRPPGGKCAGTIAIVNDITTRKTSEAHVIQLAALVESAGEAIITLTPSGEIATWNEAAERLYGYSRDEALGKHAPTLLASDPASRETLLAAVARGELGHVEGLDIRKGGDPVDVSVTDAPIREANGRVVAVARVARDITERKTAQFESARLAAIVESSADAIISLNTDGVIETWNTGAEQLYGYSAAGAVGRHALTLLARESTQRGQLVAREASDVLRDVEVTDVAKDGTPVQVSGTSSPIRDSDGRITGVSLILRDISARRRLEAERRQIELELAGEHERLLESEIRFRQIFDHAGLAIALVDAARRVVATNPGFERLFGYTQEEVVGQAAERMTYADDVTSDAEPFRDLIAGFGDCYTTEKRYVRKDGSVFWGRLTYSPARNEDGAVKFAIAIMEDVTAIHETQLALTKSERRLEQMFEDARTPMAVTDARGGWVRTNRALCELLGYSQQELRAVSFADVTHPDDVGASLASLRELLADRLTSF